MDETRAIARRFGTPVYVYDLDVVRAAASWLRADLPAGADVLYSLKANPHPAVVGALCDVGIGSEVSSAGEIAVALAAGCPADHVLFTGPGKTVGAIETAIERGVTRFSVESTEDRARLDACARRIGVKCEYLVRLNGAAGSRRGSLRMTGTASAFGVDTGDVGALAALLAPADATASVPIGVHTFFATNVEHEDALVAEFERSMETVATACTAHGFTPAVVDLGGGFAAPHGAAGSLRRHPQLVGLPAAAARIFPPSWSQIQVVFESGRYLAATCGTLVTEVLDVKTSNGRTFAVVDAGINAFGGMSGLGRLHSPAVQPTSLDSVDARAPSQPTSLVGPLCTPLDVHARSMAFEPRVGELLAIPNTGAYGLTASLIGFLGHAAPIEVIVDGGSVVSARRLEIRPVDIEVGA